MNANLPSASQFERLNSPQEHVISNDRAELFLTTTHMPKSFAETRREFFFLLVVA